MHRPGQDHPLTHPQHAQCLAGLFGRTLVDVERRSTFAALRLHKSLPGQETILIHRAARHIANHAPALIYHRVPQVRHAHTLLIEGEARHFGLALALPLDEGLSTDEPRLIGFHIRPKAGLAHPQVQLPAHLVPVERQPGLCAQRIARPQPARLDPPPRPHLQQLVEQRIRHVGVHEQLKRELLTRVTRARYHQVKLAQLRLAQLRALEQPHTRQGLLIASTLPPQRHQDIARLRSLQSDVYAHICAFFGIAQIAQDRIASISLLPRVLTVNDHFPVLHRSQPGPILVVIRSIYHHQELFFGSPVDHQVVNHVRIRVKEMRIA